MRLLIIRLVSGWGECHINGCECRASLFRPWLAVHRGVCKDNLALYLAAFKVCRRSRSMKPIDAVKEVLRDVLMAPLAVIKDCSSSNPETDLAT